MRTSWAGLIHELDAWGACDTQATLWLRDDDTRTRTFALERLLNLAAHHRIPVGLAVIPFGCESSVAGVLEQHPGLSVLQHGYAHHNHAPEDQKKAEYGGHREVSIMSAELIRGTEVLRTLFPEIFLPVLVPPWNRISPGLLRFLPCIGFEALSTYQARACHQPVVGLTQSNCHADLIDWRASRTFIGESDVLGQITTHLRRRREGEVDNEATGVLSHHLDHDEGCWRFLDRLFECTQSHPAARWSTVAEVMWRD